MTKAINIISICSLLLSFIQLKAQLFVEQNSNIAGTLLGKARWADCDNDKDLDLLIIGLNQENKKTSRLHLNIGSLIFPELPMNIPGLFRGDIAWGDLNGDGYQDFVVCGIDKDFRTRTLVYLNTKENNFNLSKELDGFSMAKILIGDFDNNKENDILIMGRTNREREALIYFGSNKTFVKKVLKLPKIIRPEAEIFDFNGDSLLDLIIAGHSPGFSRVTKIFVNKNNGIFEPVEMSIPKFSRAAISVSDFDKNGLEDFIISGSTKKGNQTLLCLNKNGNFVPAQSKFKGVYRGDNGFIDCDNDGDLDILISGMTENGPVSLLYINSEGNFSEASMGLTSLYDVSIDIGDLENDGDKDILINGRTKNNNYLCIIYRNGTIIDQSQKTN